MRVTRRVGAFVRFDLMPPSARRFLRRDRCAERRCGLQCGAVDHRPQGHRSGAHGCSPATLRTETAGDVGESSHLRRSRRDLCRVSRP